MRSLALTLALTTAALLHVQTLSQIPAQPAPPHLEISTPNHQTTFHIGERIPLTLAFTGPADTYGISLFNRGREIDRLHLDNFELTPEEGWTDSLAAYYAFTPFRCCGQVPSGTLSPIPTTLDMNLNEWARFDEPGTYDLTIVSRRIHPALGEHIFVGPDAVELRSNTLHLRIIPATLEWQRSVLKRTRSILAEPQQQSEDPWAKFPARQAGALADLRYLASTESMPVLAASLREGYSRASEEAVLGFAGLPRSAHDAALSAMNRQIDDPAFPITRNFLEAMMWLQIGDETLPAEDASEEEAASSYNVHLASAQPLLDDAWKTVASQLPRKVEPARAITAQTLLTNAPAKPAAEAKAQLGAILRASFPGLSIQEKTTILRDDWDTIGDLSLLPQLRTLAQMEPSEETSAANYPDPTHDIRAAALERWFGFEPEAAKREILDLIGSATPALSAGNLTYLPPQSFPQFEPIWAKALAEDDIMDPNKEPDAIGSLLVRFGTGDASAQITAMVTNPHQGVSGNAMIYAYAYLVRFDPVNARRLLKGSGILTDIAELASDPLLTEIALEDLKSEDDGVVIGVVRYLSTYGDETARKPMLDRYLKWSEAMSAVPGKIAPKDNGDFDPMQRDPRQLGETLAVALLGSQGWLADAPLVDTVQQHCHFEGTCALIKRMATPDHTIAVDGTSRITYNVGIVYSIPTLELFESKLDQFPKGTSFTLVHGSSNSAQRKLEATLPPILLKHGMKLAD